VLPAVALDESQAAAVGLGQAPAVSAPDAPVDAGARSVVLRGADGRALALAHLTQVAGALRAQPDVVFPWAVRGGRAA
jgi:hypothetical protein